LLYVHDPNGTETIILIGYARTSTLDQKAGIESQTRDLAAVGCEKVFTEQVSSVDVANREQFMLALEFIREGDTLVITKLDRLARSVAHLVRIMETLKTKGAHLRILNMGIDTATPTGKLMQTVLGASLSSNVRSCWNGSARASPKPRPMGSTRGASPLPEPRQTRSRLLRPME
jgi:hypothetical protein